ncbi:MAG: HAD family phosphatase [Candidatus Microthrix sp.]|uniref:HAD family phosphatase n=1 Tax=Candidatus Neomicrothrix subdominans TaxID=2954438 RepID=A0A936TC10_9ACTN|nr:HAD family phosphatase [Candidatus Microthrix sp.]MBK9295976.1 HAD family phosphatase [Candidatus Microthrix subdominans]
MTPSPRSQSWSVVASDLDGTLLDSGRGVTKRTAKAVERVRRNDGRFLMVTGRPVRWITQIVEQLGTTDPVIALNGAVVWDPVSGDVLSSRPLDLELVIDLVERLSEQDPDLCWAIERPLGYARSPEFAPGHNADGSEIAPIDELLTGELTKLLGRSHNFSPERFERIRALVGDAAQVTHSGNEALIEIAAPGVHKAATLASLVDGWALSPDDVIAFGDQVNDEEMLAWAGWGVAMGNAAPHVQRLADEVTLSNDQAGVARILEREFPTA